jgi:hypothetical protein
MCPLRDLAMGLTLADGPYTYRAIRACDAGFIVSEGLMDAVVEAQDGEIRITGKLAGLILEHMLWMSPTAPFLEELFTLHNPTQDAIALKDFVATISRAITDDMGAHLPRAGGGPHHGAAVVPQGHQCGGLGQRLQYDAPGHPGGTRAPDERQTGIWVCSVAAPVGPCPNLVQGDQSRDERWRNSCEIDAEFVHGDIAAKVFLMHATESAQEVTHRGPHPFVGEDRGIGQGKGLNMANQGILVSMVDYPQPHLAARWWKPTVGACGPRARWVSVLFSLSLCPPLLLPPDFTFFLSKAQSKAHISLTDTADRLGRRVNRMPLDRPVVRCSGDGA